MRSAMFLSLALLASVGTGCGPNISAIRTGALFPPQAPDCQVRFINIEAELAGLVFDRVGLITVAGADEITAKTREAVRRKACNMGGNAVSLNAAVDTGSSLVRGMTQFQVLRVPEAPAQQTAKTPTPTTT